MEAGVSVEGPRHTIRPPAVTVGGIGAAPRLTTTAVKTSAYTAAANQLVPVNAAGGAVTITLPSASAAGIGAVVAVQKTDTSVNAVTVTRAGSNTINTAATTATISLTDEALTFTSDGTSKWTTSAGHKSLATLDTRFSKRGDLFIDPRDPAYGAVGDGVADDTAAVLAAFTAANAAVRTGVGATILHPGATVILRGKFNLATLASAIPIRCNVKSVGAEFIAPASYAGTVLLVGHSTSGTILQDADIRLPDVIKATGTAFVAGSIGVTVQNLYNSDVVFGRTIYFETGVNVTGLGNGTVYNRFHLGWISYCKVSLQLKPGTGGWVNQNLFAGGGIQQSAGYSGGIRQSGYRHLVLDGAGINTISGNVFEGVSFEGDVSEYAFYVHHASQNQFNACRFEAGTAFTAVTVSGSTLTAAGHGLIVGDMIVPTYTGTLPTGMAAVTPYYVVATPDANTFSISRNKGGTAVTFSTAGSGVIYARPHRIYYDTAGVGVSSNVIKNPVNPLEWLDIVHSTAVAAGNSMETAYYRSANAYAPEDLPFFRARNSASSLALVRPVYASYAPTSNPFEQPDAWAVAMSDRGFIWKSGQGHFAGTGSPEGVLTAPPGSTYLNLNGGAGTTFYLKESGTGNTGWSPTPSYTPRTTSVATSGTPTPSATTDDMYSLTALAQSAAFAVPAGSPGNGQHLVLRIRDNGTARALTWNAIYRWIGVLPPATTVPNKILYVGMLYHSTDAKWDVLAITQEG